MAGPTDLVGLFDVFLNTVRDHKEGNAGKSGNNMLFLIHKYPADVSIVFTININYTLSLLVQSVTASWLDLFTWACR